MENPSVTISLLNADRGRLEQALRVLQERPDTPAPRNQTAMERTMVGGGRTDHLNLARGLRIDGLTRGGIRELSTLLL